MSAGYASRLKEYPHKGICGLPERQDTARAFQYKLQRLVELVRNRRVVILTGAGISTAVGIPDFRGPRGIWTLEQQQKKHHHRRTQQHPSERPSRKPSIASIEFRSPNIASSSFSSFESSSSSSTVSSEQPEQPLQSPQPLPSSRKRSRAQQDVIPVPSSSRDHRDSATLDFSTAQPSYTHQAITYLCAVGMVRFVITQNVDGLHRRSGLSRLQHAVLHGCVFTETCEDCQAEYFRDVEVGGMSFQPTGRYCNVCGGILRDTLLDWEDALPEDDLDRATTECENADVVLCLGTSLRIEPAGMLPTLAKKFVIVNLQETPYDTAADLVIRAKVDDVMGAMMKLLGLQDWEKTFEPPLIERISFKPWQAALNNAPKHQKKY